jgi:hypothetical protein
MNESASLTLVQAQIKQSEFPDEGLGFRVYLYIVNTNLAIK